ncbi:MAG: polysaccharide biosynthesis/export family protein [Salegentibacter sp.]|uniref:polysaccharide biosynthesis/export family protein n=1 Tax=Salegentibacter sp. TaxID=1903072 RepID=UPI0028705F61|nr:polysaccharide biosynthesis/export family protein [Salegentibacter sp.]MDR9457408.1 polysaccharide biosynthesis/export family protein [Salegentibacter sp.]
MEKYPLLLLVSFLIFSCSTKKEIVYFHDIEELEGYENIMDYEPVIEPNDVLRINVSSLNEEVVKPFQPNTQGQQGGGGGGQNMSLTGYLVDPDGNIQFPVLGAVEVAGMKRSEVQQELQSKIRDFVTDAVVDVRIVNFKVTVLGETGASRVEVSDGRITVPELIAEVGDIGYDGRRQNILVIREKDGVKSYGRVDLTDANDVFKNPYYYLKQNDIVYVEPTYRAVKSAGFFTSYQGIISLGTTIISMYLLINSL